MRARRAVIGAALVAVAAVGLAGAPSSSAAAAGAVIRVPRDAPTIQQAVDEARPGTLVLVAPGVYHEAVTIGAPHHDIEVRGEDRTGTVVDCGFAADDAHRNGFHVLADAVAVDNLTARDCADNGVFWEHVTGYRGSYLNAVRNGDYGLYALGSTRGQWDHDYAAGSPDAGFYIGGCYPCHALITDVESAWNGLGYSGTNSGGDLRIVRSSFHDNRAGIVTNSQSDEPAPPQRGATIVGNRVASNTNAQSPAIDIAATATGSGILVAGGNDNLVERNLVSTNALAGIGIIPYPEQVISPGPHATNFDARSNRVVTNTVRASQYGLVLIPTISSTTDAGGNCFAANRAPSAYPPDLQRVVPCGGRASPFRVDVSQFFQVLLGPKPPSPDYQTVALPPLCVDRTSNGSMTMVK